MQQSSNENQKLEQQLLTKLPLIDTTSSQPFINTHVVGSENQTTGIGVYCKCGGIIYCCTDDCYSERGGKKEVSAYFDKGYQVGRISKGDVQRLWGCKCQPELF